MRRGGVPKIEKTSYCFAIQLLRACTVPPGSQRARPEAPKIGEASGDFDERGRWH
jgi:hypothetical protein